MNIPTASDALQAENASFPQRRSFAARVATFLDGSTDLKGGAMFADHLAEAIGRAHGAALDDVMRALWAALSSQQISEAQALQLSEAINARRILSRGVQAAAGSGLLPKGHISRRKHQRPPERSVAWERRRRLAASGPMPPALAQRFTTGELAVMRIMADEVAERGSCSLCLDAIAARAGVSRSLAKGAIREARGLGMLEVRERRRTGAKSLPNVVTIIDREWLAWMKRGAKVPSRKNDDLADRSAKSGIGGRNFSPTDKRVQEAKRKQPSHASQKATGGQSRVRGGGLQDSRRAAAQ